MTSIIIELGIKVIARARNDYSLDRGTGTIRFTDYSEEVVIYMKRAKVPYDRYYQEADYFGPPLRGMVQFFDSFDRGKTVLDLGCGQGRDALMLGRMGYCVIGVDISSIGINQMNVVAKKEGLNVKGIVKDINSYSFEDDVDVFLTDSMLHFYQKDKVDEIQFVNMLMSQMKVGMYWCNCIVTGSGREELIKRLIKEHSYNFEWIHETITHCHKYDASYFVTIIKRIPCGKKLNPR